MTHFASAADYTSAQTETQLAYFHEFAGAEPWGRQCARAAHFQHECDRVRPHRRLAHAGARGHALYGYVSPARGEAPPQLLDVKPALTWKAKLLEVKELPEGAWWAMGQLPDGAPMRVGILGRGTRMAFFTACRIAGR